MLVGLVGVVDDSVGIRQRYKPLLVAAASPPLILALGKPFGQRSKVFAPPAQPLAVLAGAL